MLLYRVKRRGAYLRFLLVGKIMLMEKCSGAFGGVRQCSVVFGFSILKNGTPVQCCLEF
jgi:hypothetical protein